MLAARFVSLPLMTTTVDAVFGAESSQLPSIFQTPLVSVLSGCLQIHLRNVLFSPLACISLLFEFAFCIRHITHTPACHITQSFRQTLLPSTKLEAYDFCLALSLDNGSSICSLSVFSLLLFFPASQVA